MDAFHDNFVMSRCGTLPLNQTSHALGHNDMCHSGAGYLSLPNLGLHVPFTAFTIQ